MRRLLCGLLLLLSLPVLSFAYPGSLYHHEQDVRPHLLAQTGNPHNVTLTWTQSTDFNTTNCTTTSPCVNNVYRAPNACSTSSSFLIVAGPPATVTYNDTSVSVGQTYCYQVTFSINGLESAPSNQVTATIRPFAPTSLGEQTK